MQAFDARSPLGLRVGLRSTRNATSRPTIIAARLCSVTSRVANLPTVLPRRITVMRSEICSTSGSL